MQENYWTCGVCHIITMGEWDAEVQEKNKKSDWLPCCKACSVEIRIDFIPEEDERG